MKIILFSKSVSWHHGGGPRSKSGQFMWDLWWTKWHWKKCFFFLAHPFSTVSVTLPVIHMNIDVRGTLPLSEGQAGDTWAPCDKSDTHSCIEEHQKRKALLLSLVPQAINPLVPELFFFFNFSTPVYKM